VLPGSPPEGAPPVGAPPVGAPQSGGHAANAGGDKLIVVAVNAIIKTVLNRRLLVMPTMLNILSIRTPLTRASALQWGGDSTALLLINRVLTKRLLLIFQYTREISD